MFPQCSALATLRRSCLQHSVSCGSIMIVHFLLLSQDARIIALSSRSPQFLSLATPEVFFVVSCFIPSVRVPPHHHPDIFFVSLRTQVPNISGVRRTSVSSLRFTISRFSSSSSRLALIASLCTHGDDGKVFVRAPSGVGSFLAFHL